MQPEVCSNSQFIEWQGTRGTDCTCAPRFRARVRGAQASSLQSRAAAGRVRTCIRNFRVRSPVIYIDRQ